LQGTPEDVLAESRECMEKGGAGGGYILGAGDMVPRDAPLENLDAMMEAAKVYGRYDE
jgi:uroporphyrinogen decarboxylase